jgi:hypothetical protein
MCSLGDIASASRLNGKQNIPNVPRFNGINGQMPDNGEDISFEPIHQRLCVPGRFANRPPSPPHSRDLLKTRLRFTLTRFNLLLLCLGFGSAFGHRIAAGCQSLASCEVKLPGLVESDKRVLPQCHHLFLAIEAIAP